MIPTLNRRNILSALLGATLFFGLLIAYHGRSSEDGSSALAWSSGKSNTDSSDLTFGQVTPEGKALNVLARKLAGETRIVARVFYGRRALVEILEVYLRRNLRTNGGVLDEVEFAWQEGSTQPEDVKYLDRLVEVEPSYTALKGSVQGGQGFAARYDAIRNDTMYLKIDDDMLFIDDKACASLVIALMENPDYKVVTANVVRHPLMTHIHARKGALLPFAFVQDEGVQNTAEWRPSLQPEGHFPDHEEDYKATQIPVQRYSYLPIRSKKFLGNTPLSRVEYGPPGVCAWASPYCSVHAHMSFFSSREAGTLDQYDFGTWDMHMMFPERYSVNFIAWRGRYIFEGLPDGIIPGDDEHWIAVEQVKLTGNHHYAIGRALTSHLAYGQPVGFARPDYDIIVQKYKSLARETTSLIREWNNDSWHMPRPA